MAAFPHHLRITRPGEGGAQDPETGAWLPAPPVVVYDGAADVQDEGPALAQAGDGTPTVESDAAAYLEVESAAAAIRVGDDAVVTWEGGEQSEGQVERVRRLDAAVMLRWL